MTLTLSSVQTSLAAAIVEWTDWDVAEFRLAIALGILEPDTSFSTDAKHIFWSRNLLGSQLDSILRALVGLGALEFDAEEERVRWNPDFNWRDQSKSPSA
jgi:hypothetical protein